MRLSLAKFSESEASNHTRSSAAFITITFEFRFSVRTSLKRATEIASEFVAE